MDASHAVQTKASGSITRIRFNGAFPRDFVLGGIGVVEMLFRCNILALIGEDEILYPKERIMIWDDHQHRNIGKLEFRTEVLAVKLRRDRVVAVLEKKIYVYNLQVSGSLTV